MEEPEQMPELIVPVTSVSASTCPTQQICSILSIAARSIPRRYLEGLLLRPPQSYRPNVPQLVGTSEPALYDEQVTWWIH